jgi:hypothetical protein
VAPLIPCRRQTSAVFAPASCSRRIAMICSSVNFDLLISGPLLGPDSSIRWTSYRGAQHTAAIESDILIIEARGGLISINRMGLPWCNTKNACSIECSMWCWDTRYKCCCVEHSNTERCRSTLFSFINNRFYCNYSHGHRNPRSRYGYSGAQS